MLEYIWSIGAYALSYTGKFDRAHWIVIFVIALFVGFICTRGFGSRSTY